MFRKPSWKKSSEQLPRMSKQPLCRILVMLLHGHHLDITKGILSFPLSQVYANLWECIHFLKVSMPLTHCGCWLLLHLLTGLITNLIMNFIYMCVYLYLYIEKMLCIECWNFHFFFVCHSVNGRLYLYLGCPRLYASELDRDWEYWAGAIFQYDAVMP